ncbi:MAG: hypothetical protein GWP59_07015 [Chlamydiales bacterium]|nr:hypothetical protein [Chlamydiales bacterium]NCF71434.1 hypothetical protein [Chlamydiales bacterium]
MVVMKTIQRLLPTAVMVASTTTLVKNRHCIDFKSLLFDSPGFSSCFNNSYAFTPQSSWSLSLSKEELLLNLGASVK